MKTDKTRLVKALARQGLTVTPTQNQTYLLQRTNAPDSPVAEILLPDEFPVEEKAFQQLANFTAVTHPNGQKVLKAIATPDIHPGNLVPVGAVIVTPNDMVIPAAIGTDIACGMRLHTTNITKTQFLEKKTQFLNLLKGDLLLGTRNLPMSPNTMYAIFQSGIPAFLEEVKHNPLGQLAKSNFQELEQEIKNIQGGEGHLGNPYEVPEDLIDTSRPILRDGDLGTLGSGNHFLEVQYIDNILDPTKAYEWNVKQGFLAIMIHTGSRAVGMYVGQNWSDKAKHLWPKTHKYPESGIFPLVDDPAVSSYLLAQNAAANYAMVNRLLLAEMVRQRIKEVFGKNKEMPLVYDLSHNIVLQENGYNYHRKGATTAHLDQPVIIPGSMGHPSYLLKGLGNEHFLQSASHGAGRATNRFNMGRNARNNLDLGLDKVECITLKEERKIEEAPKAYKDIGPIVNSQIQAGMVSPVAKLLPLVTFKA